MLSALPEAAKEEMPLFGPPCADPASALEMFCVAENSRHGFQLLDSTLRLASSGVKSRTALGIAGTLYDGAIRSRSTAKEHDETSLDYFGERYYTNGSGRFMTADYVGYDLEPVGVPWANFNNPQSLNLYSYVTNNPTSFTDPDGHDCVLQSRTGTDTEQVSVTSGDCSHVSTGDGQTKTFVNGTVTGVQAGQDGKSIDIGFKASDGSTGVQNANAAPIPENINTAYQWGNNAQGYQTLAGANQAVGTFKGIGTFYGASAAVATCVLFCEAAGTALVGAESTTNATALRIMAYLESKGIPATTAAIFATKLMANMKGPLKAPKLDGLKSMAQELKQMVQQFHQGH